MMNRQIVGDAVTSVQGADPDIWQLPGISERHCWDTAYNVHQSSTAR